MKKFALPIGKRFEEMQKAKGKMQNEGEFPQAEISDKDKIKKQVLCSHTNIKYFSPRRKITFILHFALCILH